LSTFQRRGDLVIDRSTPWCTRNCS